MVLYLRGIFMNKKLVKLLKCFTIACGVAAGAIVSTNKQAIKIDAVNEVEKIHASDPFDDLMTDDKFKQDYFMGVYKFDHVSPPRFLQFYEYKYQKTYTSDYGLYLYVFNPNDKKPIDVLSEDNSVQMSVGSNNGSYKKYKLELVKKTTNEIENKFYKFKIVTDENFYNLLNCNERIYNVSSFEIKLKNESEIKDIEIGNTYSYTGYAKGCDNNDESTLLCEKVGLDYINLEIKTGYKRSGFINEGLTKAIDLHYAYFEIPNKYIENYGQPYSVSYQFYKYPLDRGCFYISNEDYYDEDWQTLENHGWAKYLIWDPYKFNLTNVDISLFDFDESMSKIGDMGLYAFNSSIGKENKFETVPLLGNRLFRGPSHDSKVTSEEIQSRIDTYGLNYFSSTKRVDAYSEILESTIDDLTDPADPFIIDNPDLNIVAKLLNWQVYGHGPFGRTQLSGASWSDVAAFEVVNSIEDASGSVYTINENDVESFNTMFSSTVSNDTTMVILRYCESEYWTAPIQFVNLGVFSTIWNDVGYVFYPTVIQHFDILTLGFKVDKLITVIPVVSNPQTVVPEGTPPADDRPDDELDWYDRLVGKNSLNIKLIIGIVGGVILIFLLIKLISSITDVKAKKSAIKANNLEVKKYKDEKKEKRHEKK